MQYIDVSKQRSFSTPRRRFFFRSIIPGILLSLSLISSTPVCAWTGKVCGVSNPAKVTGVSSGSINKVSGVASAAPTYATCKELYDAGFLTSGNYTIDPDGAGGNPSFTAYCDQTTSGGGWTMILGSSNPTDLCSRYFSASGNYSSYTCSSSQARLDVVDTVGGSAGFITIGTDFAFQELRYSGTVFSSGGTNSGVWDPPDNSNRVGGFVLQGCSSGPYSAALDFGAGGTNASWYVWSDNGNTCGSTGGYWILTQVYVREGLPVSFTSCKAAYDAGYTSSGEYILDPDGAGAGASFTAYCDQTNNGGGWTMLVGSTNPTNLCARYFSASGTYTNYSCSATNVRIDAGDGTQVPYADSTGTLTITTDFNFRYMRFTGSVFSSGGTGNGVWDYPDNSNRTGSFTLQGCTSGLYSNTNDFGSNGTTAAWYVWSDYGNTCGGSGAYWDISTIYVKEQ